MFTIENGKMTVMRGDTAIFDINLINYTFVEGDRIVFTVKKTINDRKPFIKKVVTEFDFSCAKFQLSSEDTTIPVGEYVYDVQCSLADGRVDTIILPTSFKVIGGITDGR